MSENDAIELCEELIDNLTNVINGQNLLAVAAAIGHIIGRSDMDPVETLAFFDTVAANASLYVTCTCGECDVPTRH